MLVERGVFTLCYADTTMQRMMITLSDDEYETLRQLAFERRTSMTGLVRKAIDEKYGTSGEEIGPPGRRPQAEAEAT